MGTNGVESTMDEKGRRKERASMRDEANERGERRRLIDLTEGCFISYAVSEHDCVRIKVKLVKKDDDKTRQGDILEGTQSKWPENGRIFRDPCLQWRLGGRRTR
jgi:hypothetical protein